MRNMMNNNQKLLTKSSILLIEVESLDFLRGRVDVIEDAVVERPREPVGDGHGADVDARAHEAVLADAVERGLVWLHVVAYVRAFCA